jgi:hypothetical protein
MARDRIVTRIEHPLTGPADGGDQTFGHERTTGLSPVHGVIVQEQILRGLIGIGRHPVDAVFLKVSFQHDGSKVARTTVNQGDEFIPSETQLVEGARVVNLFNRL